MSGDGGDPDLGGIDLRTISTSIDTHPHQTSQKRALTDIAYFPSIDTGVDRVREGDYSIGSWADDHHHESYAVETEIHEPGVDEPHEDSVEKDRIQFSKIYNIMRQLLLSRGDTSADHVRYTSSIPPYIYVILREEPYGPHSLNNSSSNKTVLHLLKMISSAAPVAKAAVCHSTFGSLHFRDSRNIKKMTSSWESASLP
ncbi:hypothetical protein Bca101_087744 [Brassica carinata]